MIAGYGHSDGHIYVRLTTATEHSRVLGITVSGYHTAPLVSGGCERAAADNMDRGG